MLIPSLTPDHIENPISAESGSNEPLVPMPNLRENISCVQENSEPAQISSPSSETEATDSPKNISHQIENPTISDSIDSVAIGLQNLREMLSRGKEILGERVPDSTSSGMFSPSSL